MARLLTATQADLAGKIRSLSDENVWYVRCKHCLTENRLNRLVVPTEEDASFTLKQSGWRLSNPGKKYIQRNWSCPRCAKWWQDTTPTATYTAGSAGEPAAKRAILLPNLRQEVQQLKAEIVELKAEVDKWKDLAQRHVADKAEHVDEIRKLRQEIDQLRAQASAVPDDD